MEHRPRDAHALPTRVRAETTSLVDAAGTVIGSTQVRGGAAWTALRGGRVGPPLAVRRWPWAVAAAVLGAAAGAAAALLVGRLLGSDAPDAQAPEDVRAVVDRPLEPPTGGSTQLAPTGGST